MPNTKDNALQLLDQIAASLTAEAAKPTAPPWAALAALGLPFVRTALEGRPDEFFTAIIARMVPTYASLAGDELGGVVIWRDADGRHARWEHYGDVDVPDLTGLLSSTFAELVTSLASLPMPDLGGGLFRLGQIDGGGLAPS